MLVQLFWFCFRHGRDWLLVIHWCVVLGWAVALGADNSCFRLFVRAVCCRGLVFWVMGYIYIYFFFAVGAETSKMVFLRHHKSD